MRVHDRCNWDGNKSTEIGPITVEDKELQALHRKRLAREYDVDGTSDEITGTVDPDDAASAQPPAGDGRDGSRGDPGRSRGQGRRQRAGDRAPARRRWLRRGIRRPAVAHHGRRPRRARARSVDAATRAQIERFAKVRIPASAMNLRSASRAAPP